MSRSWIICIKHSVRKLKPSVKTCIWIICSPRRAKAALGYLTLCQWSTKCPWGEVLDSSRTESHKSISSHQTGSWRWAYLMLSSKAASTTVQSTMWRWRSRLAARAPCQSKMPWGEVPLVFVPVRPLTSPLEGQTLRSPRPKVTSVLARLLIIRTRLITTTNNRTN